MSDSVSTNAPVDPARSRRGQSMVEMALVLPILMTLLVMTIDTGRLYFGWVAMTNAARVGANYAADHANWGAGEQTRYEELVSDDADTGTCSMASMEDPVFTRAGVVVTDPQLGDYVTATLECDFTLITPLAGQVLGVDVITLTATSTFPVRDGCASCPPPPPAPEPVPPTYCREVPVMAGLSVAGARAAWASAGFSVTNFAPTSGSDTRTLESVAVTEDDATSTCSSETPGTWAIFSSDAVATLTPPDPTDATCWTVPNLTGMTIGSARTAWTDAGFTGTFEPPDQNSLVVSAQTTDPASTGGVSCLPVETIITVTPGPAWAAPPPPPCRVPNFSDKKKSEAGSLWDEADFSGAVSFVGQGNNDWKVQRQSLVGGDWVDCTSDITLYRDP